MTGSGITGICAIVLAIILPINTAMAADRSVFNGKSISQHELTEWEKKKMAAEFKNKFSASGLGERQKLGANPWKAKKQRGQQIQRTVSWGECRDFVLEKRNHCYQEGRGAYQCERLYEARSIKCDNDY